MSSACPPVSAFLLSALVALPALAQERPMSAAEFEAYTTGKTLTFSSDGYAYGMEEYDADRRVRWSFLDGDCREGKTPRAGDAAGRSAATADEPPRQIGEQ